MPVKRTEEEHNAINELRRLRDNIDEDLEEFIRIATSYLYENPHLGILNSKKVGLAGAMQEAIDDLVN